MLEAWIRVPPLCPWMTLLRKNVRSIDFLSCRPVFEGSGSSAVVTYESAASPSEIASTVRRCDSVVRASFTKLGKSRGMGVVVSSRCPCRELGLSEQHIVGIYLRDSGLVFRMLLPDRRELEHVLERLKTAKVGYEVLRLRRPKAGPSLTSKQQQALVHALINGYFNYPRPKPLRLIARKMGVSPSAFSETLRRAVKKSVLKLIMDEGFSRDILGKP